MILALKMISKAVPFRDDFSLVKKEKGSLLAPHTSAKHAFSLLLLLLFFLFISYKARTMTLKRKWHSHAKTMKNKNMKNSIT